MKNFRGAVHVFLMVSFQFLHKPTKNRQKERLRTLSGSPLWAPITLPQTQYYKTNHHS